ncbi:MAG: iron-sulfur cluster assembly scaffold protein [Chakrabartia sp.]
MASALYTTEILRLATSVPLTGRLNDPQGQDARRAPVCGSRISVDVDVDAAGRIVRFAQSITACALGQASASLLGAEVIGRTPADIAQVAADLARWLRDPQAQMPDWPGMSVFEPARQHPGRHGAICLPFEAAAAAGQAALSAQSLARP